MTKTDGGPAYPCYTTDDWGHEDQWLGMSKLERFAMAAMQGDWARPGGARYLLDVSDERLLDIARLYYRMARAMVEVGEEEAT